MAEPDGLSQADGMQYSDDESNSDDGSNGGEEEWLLNPQTVFNNMLHVARRMSHKDRQQQIVLLSLAISAITQADAGSQSDGETDKRSWEGAQVKDIARKETKKENPDLFSSARTWSPEDHALVKKLRAKNFSWDEINKHHFPGRTRGQIIGRYKYWIKKNENAAKKGNQEESEPDGAEKLESEIVLTGHDQHDMATQEDADEEMAQAPPTPSTFELMRRANMEENQALLNRITLPMDTPQQAARPRWKKPLTSSTLPNSIRRSERRVSARRTV